MPVPDVRPRTAMRRSRVAVALATVLALGSLAATSSVALAIACTPPGPAVPGAPLPGSCFEGDDGNQVDSDGGGAGNDRVDWQSITGATSSLADNAIGNLDSVFGHGSNQTDPDSWTFDFRNAGPSKPDILSGYLGLEPNTNDLFLDLAFIRASNKGPTHLAFELNQALPGYRNATQGGTGATIAVPTRSTGDLLITYSTDPAVVGVCRWEGDEHGGDWLKIDGSSAAGGSCSAVGPNLGQAATNAAVITAANNFLSAQALAARVFAEASINLTEILNAMYPSTDPCFTFQYAWIESRKSVSVTSEQKDVILPSSGVTIAACAA